MFGMFALKETETTPPYNVCKSENTFTLTTCIEERQKQVLWWKKLHKLP